MKANLLTTLTIHPDASINQQTFDEQMNKNEGAWTAAFDFLRKNNLATLDNGRYNLAHGTYVAVSEYDTKAPETAQYEVHRTYTDIQYVAEGEEYIEVLPLEVFKEEQNYIEGKDIIFFEENPEGTKLHADKTRFFIFFPDEAHKPGLRIHTSTKVKKIVVKVPFL